MIIVFLGGLYFAGFRITYNPDLITDWNAVSGVAAWAGVLASIIAIFYAIRVPKEIADRQEKIELFEKRYEILQSFAKCRIFYSAVIHAQDLPSIQNACCRLLEVEKFSDMTEKDFAEKANESQYVFNQIPLLFTDVTDDAVARVYDGLWEFLCVVVTENTANEIMEKRKIYLDATYEFNEKYWPSMIEETSIKNL